MKRKEDGRNGGGVVVVVVVRERSMWQCGFARWGIHDVHKFSENEVISYYGRSHVNNLHISPFDESMESMV